ncbi:MAG: rhomboid family intramembrane serine protease [Chlamydiales bacterium]|nr:rhomboid family intramembrane serine protease [Chlamydiales bacterium]
MRLIGTFGEEKEAHLFCDFLANKEGIACSYEAYSDTESGKHAVRVWIEDDEQFAAATAWYERFKKSPEDFLIGEEAPIAAVHPVVEEIAPEVPLKQKRFHIRVLLRPKVPFAMSMTNLFLSICVFFFFWSGFQARVMEKEQGPIPLEIGVFTPIYRTMMFDYPCAFQALEDVLKSIPLQSVKSLKDLPVSEQREIREVQRIPYWTGFYDLLTKKIRGEEIPDSLPPLFEKIRQGEFWRMFSPCLLHGGFLHILFNMIWLWILGRQIEERTGRWHMLILILITGTVSNIAQYLMGGPFFLGFSGVVVGLAGFIWTRQKIAPWEGYPLQRTTVFFLLIFVIAMCALETFSFVMELFLHSPFSANIANTAHVVGGAAGLLLGRLPFFSREAA